MIHLDRERSRKELEIKNDGFESDRDGELPKLMAHQIEEILRLQPSNHPGMQLVAAPLTGTIFFQWSRSILRGFGARNKLALLMVDFHNHMRIEVIIQTS